jgi:hypothetical protein
MSDLNKQRTLSMNKSRSPRNKKSSVVLSSNIGGRMQRSSTIGGTEKLRNSEGDIQKLQSAAVSSKKDNNAAKKETVKLLKQQRVDPPSRKYIYIYMQLLFFCKMTQNFYDLIALNIGTVASNIERGSNFHLPTYFFCTKTIFNFSLSSFRYEGSNEYAPS